MAPAVIKDSWTAWHCSEADAVATRRHWVHNMITLRHPRNRKYITYYSAARGGRIVMATGNTQYMKFDEIWSFGQMIPEITGG